MIKANNNLTDKNSSQRGSAFFYILLGVILFGTISFTVSRGFRGQSANALTDKTANLIVSDILSYGQKIRQAVDQVRRKGCSENDISFASSEWGHSNYDHSPSTSVKCKIFDPSGGNITFRDLSDDYPRFISNTNSLAIAGHTVFFGLGTTCAANECVELYMFLRMINAEKLCLTFNKALGNVPDLPVTGGIFISPVFTGSFVLTNAVGGPEFTNKPAGCYQHTSDTHTDGTPFHDFFFILMER